MAKPESPRASKPPTLRPPRHTSSKYDFVKVRVWLGQGSSHYYVLSRFLVSRMLTVTRIPAVVAIKIALELKKLLVDASLLDVSQADLEENLFVLMKRRGYGDEYINRYKMMTRFHHQRVPLIILICGTACVGKSTIATQLAQRLNLPNVLQTDIVYELLRTSVDAPLSQTPVWARDFDSPQDLIAEFCRECRIVHRGLEGDVGKAIRDGKPIIIEGEHLDPSLFLLAPQDDNVNPKLQGSKGVPDSTNAVTHSQLPEKINNVPELDATVVQDIPDRHPPSDTGFEDSLSREVWEGAESKVFEKSFSGGVSPSGICGSDHRISTGESGVVERHQSQCTEDGVRHEFHGLDWLKGANSQELDGEQGEAEKEMRLEGVKTGVPTDEGAQTDQKNGTSKRAKPIIVPIVLKMDEDDHLTLLAEWRSCHMTDGDQHLEVDDHTLLERLRIIEDYLCSFEGEGVAVVNVSATSFSKALDRLHVFLLHKIEQGCTPPDVQ